MKTLYPDIFRVDADISLSSLNLPQAIDSLSALTHSRDTDAIIDLLDEIVPCSSIREESQPDITFVI